MQDCSSVGLTVNKLLMNIILFSTHFLYFFSPPPSSLILLYFYKTADSAVMRGGRRPLHALQLVGEGVGATILEKK